MGGVWRRLARIAGVAGQWRRPPGCLARRPGGFSLAIEKIMVN